MVTYKRLGFGLLFLTLLSFGTFGQDYTFARDTFTSMIKTYGAFIDGMETAASAEEIVVIVNAFADEMEILQPRLDEMETRYPEFESMPEPPQEIAELVDQMELIGAEVFGAFMVLIEYAEDPEVAAALDRLEIF
ncbi:MAG: hypothetical protein GW949_08385 [Spirochaetales bacterium]|nr:hypothetical protein [Spirochaetales bacterium]